MLDTVKTGQSPGQGVYVCTNCQQQVAIGDYDLLPKCPRCTNNEFVKD